jgi:predicted phosphoadenosine phosphosulfate sulfurtransferase
MKEKILQYIKTWEARGYSDGIPDEAPIELENRNKVPSYRRICLAILRNDYSLKSLGFTPKKSKYYSAYKKIEIDGRKSVKQLKLDL